MKDLPRSDGGYEEWSVRVLYPVLCFDLISMEVRRFMNEIREMETIHT